ncbi:hypothetical protein HW115_07280 [Verrucomicrobiaceae bacterium N1E253]|uniref:Ig-like domain-containing protein n=1 Tax=Oceaniferula marina TaxID=2748318 RepID=A0A851GCF5_9BACT|nr:hypothetical protein [Oceaniferula marina]NWK55408.1 hypothetical protein [Oceaniferula marina]
MTTRHLLPRPLPLLCLAGGLAALGLSACSTQVEPEPVVPISLNEGVAGLPYRDTIKALPGSTPTANMFISSGHLPSGLKLTYYKEGQQSTLDGTPASRGTYHFTITDQCYSTQRRGDTFHRHYSLTVQ